MTIFFILIHLTKGKNTFKLKFNLNYLPSIGAGSNIFSQSSDPVPQHCHRAHFFCLVISENLKQDQKSKVPHCYMCKFCVCINIVDPTVYLYVYIFFTKDLSCDNKKQSRDKKL